MDVAHTPKILPGRCEKDTAPKRSAGVPPPPGGSGERTFFVADKTESPVARVVVPRACALAHVGAVFLVSRVVWLSRVPVDEGGVAAVRPLPAATICRARAVRGGTWGAATVAGGGCCGSLCIIVTPLEIGPGRPSSLCRSLDVPRFDDVLPHQDAQRARHGGEAGRKLPCVLLPSVVQTDPRVANVDAGRLCVLFGLHEKRRAHESKEVCRARLRSENTRTI